MQSVCAHTFTLDTRYFIQLKEHFTNYVTPCLWCNRCNSTLKVKQWKDSDSCLSTCIDYRAVFRGTEYLPICHITEPAGKSWILTGVSQVLLSDFSPLVAQLVGSTWQTYQPARQPLTPLYTCKYTFKHTYIFTYIYFHIHIEFEIDTLPSVIVVVYRFCPAFFNWTTYFHYCYYYHYYNFFSLIHIS